MRDLGVIVTNDREILNLQCQNVGTPLEMAEAADQPGIRQRTQVGDSCRCPAVLILVPNNTINTDS